jgi:hypothetical protein
MIRDDWLLRQIHQLLQAALKIAAAREAEQLDRAIGEGDTALRSLIGIDADVLCAISHADRMGLLHRDRALDVPRVAAVARILQELALVFELTGDPRTRVARTAALALMLEVLEGVPELGSHALELADGVALADLPPHLRGD